MSVALGAERSCSISFLSMGAIRMVEGWLRPCSKPSARALSVSEGASCATEREVTGGRRPPGKTSCLHQSRAISRGIEIASYMRRKRWRTRATIAITIITAAAIHASTRTVKPLAGGGASVIALLRSLATMEG